MSGHTVKDLLLDAPQRRSQEVPAELQRILEYASDVVAEAMIVNV
jgi:hypothetical protein